MRKIFVLSLMTCVFAAPALAADPAPAGSGYYQDTGQIVLPSEVAPDSGYIISTQQQQQAADLAAIEAAEAEYMALQETREERERIQQWEKLDMEMKLRRYDQMVMGMQKEFSSAKNASNPFLGEQGYVIYPYGDVVPIITCRPLRMTDVALEPGEEIMGIHAGDTMRWEFLPSQSMKNGMAVAHIVVKPSQPGISTNLLVHTDRRTYNLDFTSSEKAEYLRGVAFSYQANDLTYLFKRTDKPKKALEDEIQTGLNGVDLEGLYTLYAITNKSKVDWCPEAVFDDGVKTYIRMPSRFSETPAFYVILDRKETMTNFRVKGRYYIVDRLFDRAYMKIGSKRVVIVRKDRLNDTNIRESQEANRLRTARGRW